MDIVREVKSRMTNKTLASSDWLEEVNVLTWCKSDDNCKVEESISRAIELAKELGLKVDTHVRKNVPLVVYVHNLANRCPHLEKGEALELIDEAVQKYELPLGPMIVANPKIVPESHYDNKLHCWWLLNDYGCYQSMAKEDARLSFELAGLSSERSGGLPSEVERHFEQQRRQSCVDWVGDLAGHKAGLLEFAGKRILIRSSFRLIEPKPGEWKFIGAMLTQLLGKIQLQYFNAEMKLAYETLQAGSNRPGHMNIFCGPTDGTKSLVQHSVITPVLGGRSADAARYLTGRTEFNADLAGAEHVFLDDAKPYGNWLSRHDLSENLKGFIVGKVASIHGKNRDAINLPVRWRVSMSLNDDDTALRSMPDISASFGDKANLFKTGTVKLPMPNETLEERAAVDKVIAAELPHYIDHLLKWEIPEEMRGTRFGCIYHHNADLINKLIEISDESQLLEVIDIAQLPARQNGELEKVIDWKPSDGPYWYGTAQELYTLLADNRNIRRAVEKLLSWNNATGTLLGRLEKTHPLRCTSWRHKRAGKDIRDWVIMLPKPRSRRAGEAEGEENV